jgi:hypothetical protein
MTNITLSVPSELKKKMDMFPEINWSEIARQAIKEKAYQLSILRSIISKSKLSEKGAEELGEMINKELSKKYKKLI